MPPTTARRAAIALLLVAGLFFSARVGVGDKSVSSSSPPTARATVPLTDHPHASQPAVPAAAPDLLASEAAARRADALAQITAFTDWLTAWRRATPAEQPALAAAGRELASARRAALHYLIETDPREALARAVPAGLRAELPADVQAQLETRVDGRGNLDVAIDCFGWHEGDDEPVSHLHRAATADGRRYEAYVFGRRAQQPTKFGLPLHGIAIDGALALDEAPYRAIDDVEKSARGVPRETTAVLVGGELSQLDSPADIKSLEAQLIAAESVDGPYVRAASGPTGDGADDRQRAGVTKPLSWSLGEKKILWFMVSFADDPAAPFTVAQIQAAADTMDAYYRAVSRGRESNVATILPVALPLPQSKAYYNRANLAGELSTTAIALAKAYDATGAYDPAKFDRYIIIFKSMSAYNFSGSAGIGGPQLLLNGNLSPNTICHEIGHTHTLPHADWWRAMDGTTLNGAFKEYGDIYDLMGNAGSDTELGFFNTTMQAKLGYIDDTNGLKTVTASGRYRLTRHDDGGATGTLALKLVSDTVPYPSFVEYRTAPYTKWLDAGQLDRLRNSVQLRWGPEIGPNYTHSTTTLVRIGSYLLDATPTSNADVHDAGVRIGESYLDPDAGVTIRPVAIGGTAPNEYIDVDVFFGAIDGNHNPVLTFTPPATVNVRDNVTFTATATDPDGDTVYFLWDFGDETPLPYTPSITYRFDTAGPHTVRVAAVDRKGGVAVKSVTLNVVEPAGGWVARTSGVTVPFGDVCFGGGRFVAVGDSTTILTSTDGASWTAASVPASVGVAGPRAVAHDGKRFVTVGRRSGVGFALYSDDGLAWNLGTVPANATPPNDVTFAAGRWVAVGDSGGILTSTDGATWTAATSGVTQTLNAVTFAVGQFVVVGDAGRVLVSGDGLTWQNRSVAVTGNFLGVAYYNGAWLTGTGPGSLYTSADASVWTRVSPAAGTPNTTFTSPLRLIAGKLMAGVPAGIVLASVASEWSTQTLTSSGALNISGVAEGNGTVVAVGSLSGAISSTSSASLSATTAAALTPPALRLEAESIKLSAGKPNVIAVSGTGFVKLELYANRVKVAEISGSTGSFTWTPPRNGTYTLQVRGIDAAGNSAFSPIYEGRAGLMQWRWRNPLPAGVNLNDAVRVGDRWWIAGNVGTLLTLDDAGIATLVPFPSTQHLNSIAYANGRFVIATPQTDGASRETLTPAWTSTDGYTWAETTSVNLTLNRVRYGAGTWVGAANEGNVLTSPDGSTWTSVSTGLITPLYGLVYGGNTWVAVGASGKIVTSANASTWTERTSGVTAALRDVGFSGGVFTTVGDGGTILTSTDGATWTRRTSGVTTNLNAIGVVNGAQLAAGDSGVLLTSGDGVTWSAGSLDGKFANALFVGGSGDNSLVLGRAGELYTRTTATAWRRLTTGTGDTRYGVIYAGGRFVAVGEATDAITRTTVAPVSVSTDGITWTRANANAAFGPLRAVTYGQNLYVAVGDNGKIFTSSDAQTWTARTSGVTTNLLGVAASATGFAAVGDQGIILTSSDGTAWTARASGATTAFKAIACGNNRFVAVGTNSRQSSDGVTWTAINGIGDSNTVAWLGSDGFIAAPNNALLHLSADGVTWTTFAMQVGEDWRAIAKTPFGPAVAGGTNGSLLQSINDGGNWLLNVAPTDQRVLGLASSATTVVAVGEGGTLLTFALNDSTPAPVIAAAPTARDVNGSTVLSVAAQNTTGAAYQWFKDGQPISGANNPEYTVPAADTGRLGAFTVRLTTPAGSVTSTPVGAGPVADPARLVNLSILTTLTSADDSFTFGVVIGGAGTTGSKSLLVRAAGPSLAALGVPGTLDDPKLQFYTGTAKVGENDNWSGNSTTALVMAQVGAFPYASATSRDAALWLPGLAAGNNSAVISGTGAGTVIAELYDATPSTSFTTTTPRLINVSVLKQIGSGVTAGFVIGGTGSRTVLVRAIGPTLGLAPFSLPGVVADPQLTLNRGAAVIGSNDNWGGDAKLSAAFTQVGAFALPASSRDAALVATLEPGNYTVQVSGIGGTGIALIEVYEVP